MWKIPVQAGKWGLFLWITLWTMWIVCMEGPRSLERGRAAEKRRVKFPAHLYLDGGFRYNRFVHTAWMGSARQIPLSEPEAGGSPAGEGPGESPRSSAVQRRWRPVGRAGGARYSACRAGGDERAHCAKLGGTAKTFVPWGEGVIFGEGRKT